MLDPTSVLTATENSSVEELSRSINPTALKNMDSALIRLDVLSIHYLVNTLWKLSKRKSKQV